MKRKRGLIYNASTARAKASSARTASTEPWHPAPVQSTAERSHMSWCLMPMPFAAFWKLLKATFSIPGSYGLQAWRKRPKTIM